MSILDFFKKNKILIFIVGSSLLVVFFTILFVCLNYIFKYQNNIDKKSTAAQHLDGAIDVFFDLGDGYFVDDNRVFYINENIKGQKTTLEVEGADARSFSNVGGIYYGDKDNIFCEGEKMDLLKSDFVVDDKNWSHDKKNNYFNCITVPVYKYGDLEISFEDRNDYESEKFYYAGDTNIYILNNKTGKKIVIGNFDRLSYDYENGLELGPDDVVTEIKEGLFKLSLFSADQRGPNIYGIVYVNLKDNTILKINSLFHDKLIINENVISFNEGGLCACRECSFDGICEEVLVSDLSVNGNLQRVFGGAENRICGAGDGFCGHDLSFGVDTLDDSLSRVYFSLFDYDEITNLDVKKSSFYFDVDQKKIFRVD